MRGLILNTSTSPVLVPVQSMSVRGVESRQGSRAGGTVRGAKRGCRQAAVIHKLVSVCSEMGTNLWRRWGTILCGSHGKRFSTAGSSQTKLIVCIGVQEAEKASVGWSRVNEGERSRSWGSESMEGHP